MLPSGPAPPSVPELVASDRLTELLLTVSEQADLVLVDSPPMLAASDTVALSDKIDALLVVVRLRSAKRSALVEVSRMLDHLPLMTLGAVATGTRGANTYGYGRGRAAVVPSIGKAPTMAKTAKEEASRS